MNVMLQFSVPFLLVEIGSYCKRREQVKLALEAHVPQPWHGVVPEMMGVIVHKHSPNV